MRTTPLHESHLLEAVRRKILSSDQMEQVIALARATPAEGVVADVRWATVVQGLIAGAAMMSAGLGICIDVGDHGATLGTAAYSAVGLVVTLGVAHFLQRYSWGRVPGAIVRAGSAAWVFGLTLGALSLGMSLHRDGLPYGPDYYRGYESFRDQINHAMALAAVVAAGYSVALYRFRRCAPSLGVAGGLAAFAAAMFITAPSSVAYHSGDSQALVVMGVGGALYAAAALLDRLPRGPVDGAFWLYPAAMFPMGCAAVLRIDRHEGEVIVWLPLALALGALAYANGRRFPLFFSAVATMIFPAFAVSEARAPAEVVLAVLGASALAVAVAVQLIRNRDLRAGVTREPASIWS